MSAPLQHAAVCTVQFCKHSAASEPRVAQTDDCVTNLEHSVLKLCNVVDGDEGWLKGDVEI